MEVRLNKLISDSGLCSRREADKFTVSYTHLTLPTT